MDKGSHMIGGRTYRNILTTNDQKPTGPVKSQKLGVITTAIIPNAVPQPEPKGTDLSKMITTHDEPKARVVIDESVGPGEAVWMDKQFKADAEKVQPDEKKKPGRPKKEK